MVAARSRGVGERVVFEFRIDSADMVVEQAIRFGEA